MTDCCSAEIELSALLDQWNAMVKASGSPTHGGAVGHVAALRRSLDAVRAMVRRPGFDAWFSRQNPDYIDEISAREAWAAAVAAVVQCLLPIEESSKPRPPPPPAASETGSASGR